MTEYERKVLREAAGDPQPDLHWGAAMSVAIEYLSESGYLTEGPDYRITPQGRAALEDTP